MLIACDLGINTMSSLYHGKSIAFDSIAKIADYLDASVDYLLGRKTDNNNFVIGDMSNVNNNVTGNNNNVSGVQQQPQESDNEYNEIIDYLDSLPVRERRRAKHALIEHLEDNFPKKRNLTNSLFSLTIIFNKYIQVLGNNNTIDATNDKINIDTYQFHINFFGSEYGVRIYLLSIIHYIAYMADMFFGNSNKCFHIFFSYSFYIFINGFSLL